MNRTGALSHIALLAAFGLGLLGSGCQKPPEPPRRTASAMRTVLMSRIDAGDPKAEIQLVSGFHAVEQNKWRWTEGKFAVQLRPPHNASEEGARLVLQFSLPDVVIQKLGAIELKARIDGTSLPATRYARAGQQVYDQPIPAGILKGNSARVEFELDKFLRAGSLEGRELGVIVATIALEPF
jgi:hypothetical protein